MDSAGLLAGHFIVFVLVLATWANGAAGFGALAALLACTLVIHVLREIISQEGPQQSPKATPRRR